ncbi:hypothetical protein NUH16_003340 [Penicillium rubens]|nr:hypothetical protein NUH16_003340 [Penicillium rubens]
MAVYSAVSDAPLQRPLVTHFAYLGQGNPEFTRAAQACQSRERSSGVKKSYSLQGNRAKSPSPSSVDRFHPCGTEARTVQQLTRQAAKVISGAGGYSL